MNDYAAKLANASADELEAMRDRAWSECRDDRMAAIAAELRRRYEAAQAA